MGRRVLRPPSYMGVGENCVHKIGNGTTPQGVMRDACGRGWSALIDSLAPTIESRETPCSKGK